MSTNAGGVPYLLEDGKSGLLVDKDDPAAMTEQVEHLLNEQGLAERLSKQGRET